MHVEDLTDVLAECRGDVRSVFGDQIDLRSVEKHPVVEELFGEFRKGDAAEKFSM